MSTVLERLETCMQAQRSASTEPTAHSDTAKIACGDYELYDFELYDFEHGDSQAPSRAFADAHRARSSAIVRA